MYRDAIAAKKVLPRGFKEDCPDGRLYMNKVIEMYYMILPLGKAEVKL